MSRTRKGWLALSVVAVVAATIGLAALPAFASPGTATVTGHLVDGTTPVLGADVDLYDLEYNSVRQTSTDSTGAFEMLLDGLDGGPADQQ